MSVSDFKVYTHSEYQNILANELVKEKTFKFNPRPVANIKKGIMYVFKTFNEQTYEGVLVEGFNFYKRGFNSPIQSDKKSQVTLRGYGVIKNKNLAKALREKIRESLIAATKKDFFTENCDLVLRFSGISTCSGSGSHKNKHGICISAKSVFEKLKNVEICPNNNGENITCLYRNILHSQKDFEKLKIVYSADDEKYYVSNNIAFSFDGENNNTCFNNGERGKFVHNNLPLDCIDENIYSSHTKNLSGLFCLNITGVYLNDDSTKQDTMTVWAKIENCHLVSDVYEISETINQQQQNDDEDDILNDECGEYC